MSIPPLQIDSGKVDSGWSELLCFRIIVHCVFSIAFAVSTFSQTIGVWKASGNNANGQLGDGTLNNRAAMVPFPGNPSEASAGQLASYYVSSTGELWGLGRLYLTLEDGDITSRTVPALVAGSVQTVAVAMNNIQTLFVKRDRTLWAFGPNSRGQLGDGTTSTRTVPVQVASDALAVAANGNQSFFITSDGVLWGMGWNGLGQLGDGTTTNRLRPISIASSVAAVGAGNTSTYFVKTDGSLWSMGYNFFGQLGDGTTVDKLRPVQIAANVRSIAAGSHHAAYITKDGRLWTFGQNQLGQLGDGTLMDRSLPMVIDSNVVSTSAGVQNTFYIKADGTLWASGRNDVGQYGDGTTVERHKPTLVTSEALAVVAGSYHTLFKLRPQGGTAVARSAPTIFVPLVLPVGTTFVDARALVEQPGLGVLVAVSGRFPGSATAIRTTSASVPDFSEPAYTNPQPYSLSQVARLLANGSPDPSFTSSPGADGTVNALAVQADGRILVGGTFTTYNGRLFRNLTRLTVNGAPDTSFNTGSGATAQVNAVAVQSDGKILVGGAFDNFAGASPLRSFLVRLQSDGTLDTGFLPNVSGAIHALAIQRDGGILIGGEFTTVNGVSRGRLARLTASGALDLEFSPATGANAEVVTILVQPDNKIVVAGDFTAFSGQPRSRIVRLQASGELDPGFSSQAAANNAILSLGIEADGKLVLGGAFTEVNGAVRNRLARLRSDGTLDTSFDPEAGANQEVRALLPRSDGTIFLAGLFDQYQGNGVNAIVAILGNPVRTVITRAPRSTTIGNGTTARFAVDATGYEPLSYQWLRDGVPIAGATGPTYTVRGVSNESAGQYRVMVSSRHDTVASEAASLAVSPGLRSVLSNVSARARSSSGAGTLVLGFVIGGTGTKPVLVRASGLALAPFGVPSTLPNPRLRLFKDTTPLYDNLDWDASTKPAADSVGAFAFPVGSRDSALLLSLSPGAYTAQVADEAGVSGTALVEAYDASPDPLNSAANLTNLSIRTLVGTGANQVTVGLVLKGSAPATILFRCVGAGLTAFGISPSEVLSDPVITLFGQDGRAVVINDDWGQTDNSPELRMASIDVGAFPLQAGSRDAALLVTIPPGSYTLQASGKAGTEGIAIVEAYYVP